MAVPILATKLFAPPPRPQLVLRPRLIEQLNKGLLSSRKLTLISAPAGFGKTTLVSEWIAALTPSPHSGAAEGVGVRAAWLSLDERDNDLARFVSYLVAALQTIKAGLGAGSLAVLHASQPHSPQAEAILTVLLNEIATISDSFIL
jgi:LuxR family transcriptional regulator, maltose regulon positive regulatory protein